MKQCNEPNTTVSREKSDFSTIIKEAKRLTEEGFKPSVLLAPIEPMIPFINFFYDDIDWQTGSKILKVTDKIQMNIVWSNKYALLNDFILTSPESSHYFVTPELDTKNELAVSIGNDIDNPHSQVAYFADLIAKFDLIHREAVSYIHVSA